MSFRRVFGFRIESCSAGASDYFEELEGLVAMVSCLHETVLPAAHVGLLGISPCSEASEKDQDEVEEATTEAFLLVRASQF